MAKYDPDEPPVNPSEFNDEFDDGVIDSSWILPTTYSTTVSIYPSGTGTVINESDCKGWLLLQGRMIGSSLDFSKLIRKDISSVSINNSFIVVLKHCSFSGNNQDSAIKFGIRGQADNVYCMIGAGAQVTYGPVVAVDYANGGAASGNLYEVGTVGNRYLLIAYNGNKTFSAYGSYGGVGWYKLRDVTLSNLTGFSYLFIGNYCYDNNPTGISAIDFIRWFDGDQYLIGKV